MNIAQAHGPADAWYWDFTSRLPAVIVAAGEVRVRLLQLLYLLDVVKEQKFAQGDDGRPLFRMAEVAQALGMSRKAAVNLLRWRESAELPHMCWRTFPGERAAAPAVTLAGVVFLVELIPPWRFRSKERQRWQLQRHELAEWIVKALDRDAGRINAIFEPVAASGGPVH